MPNSSSSINAQRAAEKFASLDRQNLGWLAGDDVMELADWMAHQLRPGEKVTTQMRLHEATNILKRCDAKDNGTVTQREWVAYFDKTASSYLKPIGDASTPVQPRMRVEDGHDKDDAVLSVLSARAANKFKQLAGGAGLISGDELMALAEWVAHSFRPGLKISAQTRLQEATKIMKHCDVEDTGCVPLQDFLVYYDKTAGAMLAAHKEYSPKPLPTFQDFQASAERFPDGIHASFNRPPEYTYSKSQGHYTERPMYYTGGAQQRPHGAGEYAGGVSPAELDFATLILGQAEQEALTTCQSAIQAAIAKTHFVVSLKMKSAKGLMILAQILRSWARCTVPALFGHMARNFERFKHSLGTGKLDDFMADVMQGRKQNAVRMLAWTLYRIAKGERGERLLVWRMQWSEHKASAEARAIAQHLKAMGKSVGIRLMKGCLARMLKGKVYDRLHVWKDNKMLAYCEYEEGVHRALLQNVALQRLSATLRGILKGKIAYLVELWRTAKMVEVLRLQQNKIEKGFMKQVGEADGLRAELVALTAEVRRLRALVATKEDAVVAALIDGKDARAMLDKERALRRALEGEILAERQGRSHATTHAARVQEMHIDNLKPKPSPVQMPVAGSTLSKAEMARNFQLMQTQVRARAGQILNGFENADTSQLGKISLVDFQSILANNGGVDQQVIANEITRLQQLGHGGRVIDFVEWMCEFCEEGT